MMNSITSGGFASVGTLSCRSPAVRLPLAVRWSSAAAFDRLQQRQPRAKQCLQQRQMSGQRLRQQLAAQRRTVLVQAAAQAEVAVGEEYEVFLEKPIGLKFRRGNDGGAYVEASSSGVGNTDERIQPGDKVTYVSASFGEEVWEAKNYGQVIYAIKTRNGGLYLKLRKRDGDLSIFEEDEMTDDERSFKQERAGGNYGFGTKELQSKNYEKRKEAEAEREALFEDALKKFGAKDIEGALIEFENVLAMEPKNYVGDNFSRITEIYRVTQYNIACCYGALGSIDAGIEALSDALNVGFDQYKVIREDKNLANLREDPRFTKLIDEYDEPVFNSGALKALKSIFPFNR